MVAHIHDKIRNPSISCLKNWSIDDIIIDYLYVDESRSILRYRARHINDTIIRPEKSNQI